MVICVLIREENVGLMARDATAFSYSIAGPTRLRRERAAALRQAMALPDESTAEAKQLSEERELRRLIDEDNANPAAGTRSFTRT
jgi:hypothetical protein